MIKKGKGSGGHNEAKNMSDIELNVSLVELQDKLFKLKFRHSSTGSIKNPLEIREMRRSIARIKTFIAQKKESNKK
jgi:large subunit ribosomal protein L29